MQGWIVISLGVWWVKLVLIFFLEGEWKVETLWDTGSWLVEEILFDVNIGASEDCWALKDSSSTCRGFSWDLELIGLPGCLADTSGELVLRLGRTCRCMDGFAPGCRFDVVLCSVGPEAEVWILVGSTWAVVFKIWKFFPAVRTPELVVAVICGLLKSYSGSDWHHEHLPWAWKISSVCLASSHRKLH